MERYLFMRSVIEALGRGASFRLYFARFLRIAAVGIAFAGLVTLIDAWKFISRHEAAGIIGGISYMIFFAAGIYMVVHAMVIRAGHINALPERSFTLIPLCALASLLTGEAYAAFCASVSIGGGVLIWFTRGDAYGLLRDVSAFTPHPSGEDFLGGLLLMIRGAVRGAVVLTAGYLASDLFLAVERMAERPIRGEAAP